MCADVFHSFLSARNEAAALPRCSLSFSSSSPSAHPRELSSGSVQTFGSDGSPHIFVLLDGRTVTQTAASRGGYCLTRASHGLTLPHHSSSASSSSLSSLYFESCVNATSALPWRPSSPASHVRVGFATAEAAVDAPAGYDRQSFSFASRTGQAFHCSRGNEYGRAYGVGDVIGALLTVRGGGGGGAAAGGGDEEEEDGSESELSFSVNGLWQGVAFSSLPAGRWFPCVSVYMYASVSCRFDPPFLFPPSSCSAAAASAAVRLCDADRAAAEEMKEMEQSASLSSSHCSLTYHLAAD